MMQKDENVKKGFLEGLKHAFAVEKEGEYRLTEEDKDILDKVAKKIKKMKMETPAILFLETVKPLNYVGSQTMTFFRPIVHSIFDCIQYDKFAALLEHRNCIEELLTRIEREQNGKETAR